MKFGSFLKFFPLLLFGDKGLIWAKDREEIFPDSEERARINLDA